MIDKKNEKDKKNDNIIESFFGLKKYLNVIDAY